MSNLESYLMLFKPHCREAVYAELGSVPVLRQVRAMVEAGVAVLDLLGCMSLRPVEVESEMMFLCVSGHESTIDLYNFYRRLFTLSVSKCDDDELAMLDMRVAHVDRQRYNDYVPPVCVITTYDSGVLVVDDDCCAPVLEQEFVGSSPVGDWVCEPRHDSESESGVALCATVSEFSTVSGYCYLAMFHSCVDDRVISVLGAYPTVAMVLSAVKRYDRVVCRDSRYDMSVDGRYVHVERGSKYSYDQLIAALSAVDMGYIVAGDTPAVVKVEKVKCDVCGFMVVPDGHVARCKKPLTSDQVVASNHMRRVAWLGDDRHSLDVRSALLLTKLLDTELEPTAQKYTSGAAQAKWYLDYQGYKVQNVGTSEHSLAQAFEASYIEAQKFRAVYLSQLFAQLNIKHLVGEMAAMICRDHGIATYVTGPERVCEIAAVGVTGMRLVNFGSNSFVKSMLEGRNFDLPVVYVSGGNDYSAATVTFVHECSIVHTDESVKSFRVPPFAKRVLLRIPKGCQILFEDSMVDATVTSVVLYVSPFRSLMVRTSALRSHELPFILEMADVAEDQAWLTSKFCLNDQLTDARFAAGCNLYLHYYPSSLVSLNTIVQGAVTGVELTDPFDDWAPLRRVRVSADVDKLGTFVADVRQFAQGSIVRLGTFRTKLGIPSLQLIVCGILHINASDVDVAIRLFDGKCFLQAVGSHQFSIHLSSVANAYAFDDGGPSDSEGMFPDAYE